MVRIRQRGSLPRSRCQRKKRPSFVRVRLGGRSPVNTRVLRRGQTWTDETRCCYCFAKTSLVTLTARAAPRGALPPEGPMISRMKASITG